MIKAILREFEFNESFLLYLCKLIPRRYRLIANHTAISLAFRVIPDYFSLDKKR